MPAPKMSWSAADPLKPPWPGAMSCWAFTVASAFRNRMRTLPMAAGAAMVL